MNKKKKTFIQNQWVIGTGTAIISVLGIRFFDYITGTKIISTIWNVVIIRCTAIYNFFIQKFEVSLWFLVLLPIIVIGLIIIVLWIISPIQKDSNSILNLQPPFIDYKEDVFGEVLYRWDYFKNYSDKYEISNISHYCPKCKCSIVYNSCPICHNSFYNEIKSNHEIDALIRHKIESQITN
jgi:hypothetical protein